MIGRAMLRWPASARLLSAPLPSAAPTSSLVLAIRSYATPGRPKSVVGEPSRPVKRAVKRAAAKPADGRSPAEKKVTASKRKVAAKRPQVVLTEEQKAAQQERLEAAQATMKARLEKRKALAKAKAEKNKIAELKKLALSDIPSRGAVSAYNTYTAKKLKEMGPLVNPDGTRESLGNRMKATASQWKNLGPADIEHYNHLARVNHEAKEAAYKAAVESHTPDDIRKANSARKELNRKFPTSSGKQLKYPEIHDERVVKRPGNAFIHFVTNRVGSADFNNILAKDRMKLIGAEWKALDAEEKAKYNEIAKQDKARYVEEYKVTYGHDAPVQKPRVAAAAA